MVNAASSAARSPAARSAAWRPAREQEPGGCHFYEARDVPADQVARRRRGPRRRGPRRLDLRPGGRRASRSQGDNVIFTEPPIGAATPLLGAAAVSGGAVPGGAVPGGSICGLAAGARAG